MITGKCDAVQAGMIYKIYMVSETAPYLKEQICQMIHVYSRAARLATRIDEQTQLSKTVESPHLQYYNMTKALSSSFACTALH